MQRFVRQTHSQVVPFLSSVCGCAEGVSLSRLAILLCGGLDVWTHDAAPGPWLLAPLAACGTSDTGGADIAFVSRAARNGLS